MGLMRRNKQLPAHLELRRRQQGLRQPLQLVEGEGEVGEAMEVRATWKVPAAPKRGAAARQGGNLSCCAIECGAACRRAQQASRNWQTLPKSILARALIWAR